MKLTNFTYRKQQERKPEPMVAGSYEAEIYSISEWTKNEETSLFVNVAIGKDYAYGINFRLNAEKESTRNYAERSFSYLLDVCGIDGETFEDTDVLIGKKFILVLKKGDKHMEADGFLRLGSISVDDPSPRYHNNEQQEEKDEEPPF